ncbi:MAG TPA: DUF92 domain-containing protein [Terriglobales bacterium]|jgi:uncharacterized protein (TIGR00297 family)|nr:DUF92 domain-containing protein [Terriglobales bacterium]
MEPQILVAALVTLVFAGAARLLRGVTTSGAVAGAAVCFTLYACCGAGAFAVLVSVFVLTWGATRLGYRQKQRLGVAERLSGRKASQVFANLAVSGACAAIYFYTHRTGFLVGAVAAMAEAAADTVSSEIGQARSRAALLITTWEKVPVGTDGGISWQGTIAGVAASLFISVVCRGVGLLPWRLSLIAGIAGITGMLADSCLGALFERRQKLNNDLVNLLGTAIAAGAAILVGR